MVPRIPATPLGILTSYFEPTASFFNSAENAPCFEVHWVSEMVSTPVWSTGEFVDAQHSVFKNTNGVLFSLGLVTYSSRIDPPGLATWTWAQAGLRRHPRC